jgi:hypothetical protein
MSDVYLGHDTTEEKLSAQLPEYLPKDPESGNYKFLSTIAERLQSLEDDIDTVNRAKSVQYADTVDQLEKIATLVDLQPYQNETREHFRARVISEFQILTSEGTVKDLLNATATILNTQVKNIQYTEQHTTNAGECQISVPGLKLDTIELSSAELINIIEQLIISSYRATVLRRGTFTYIDETAYSSSHNSVKGYDGLDSNGNPKNSGGTYAGILE